MVNDMKAKPVPEAEGKFTVGDVKAEGSGEDSIEPVASMWKGRKQDQGLEAGIR